MSDLFMKITENNPSVYTCKYFNKINNCKKRIVGPFSPKKARHTPISSKIAKKNNFRPPKIVHPPQNSLKTHFWVFLVQEVLFFIQKQPKSPFQSKMTKMTIFDKNSIFPCNLVQLIFNNFKSIKMVKMAKMTKIAQKCYYF